MDCRMKKHNENLAGGEELPLLAKEIGAAGAAPPQKAKEYFKAFFTSHFGFSEEWNIGGNLLHRKSKNLIQSITYRLADSLSNLKY